MKVLTNVTGQTNERRAHGLKMEKIKLSLFSNDLIFVPRNPNLKKD